jgi:nitrile hydratase accessory protein
MSEALAAADVELADLPIPRDPDGEPVFEEPWQGRAFGMAHVWIERTGTPWPEFRRRLAEAIATREPEPGESEANAYWGAWLEAFDGLVADRT